MRITIYAATPNLLVVSLLSTWMFHSHIVAAMHFLWFLVLYGFLSLSLILCLYRSLCVRLFYPCKTIAQLFTVSIKLVLLFANLLSSLLVEWSIIKKKDTKKSRMWFNESFQCNATIYLSIFICYFNVFSYYDETATAAASPNNFKVYFVFNFHLPIL